MFFFTIVFLKSARPKSVKWHKPDHNFGRIVCGMKVEINVIT